MKRDPLMTQDPLFPPSDPCCTWCLDVGDGHWIWVEECGRPDGIPVLFLHGGPGSGCSVDHRRLFDPATYRVILVDQRGAGRSRPLGGLEANTTDHLIGDLEKVRQHLGISRWILFGGSWGSLLALRYAEQFPSSVAGLVLRGIFMGSREEVDGYLERAQRLAPASVEVLRGLPGGDSDLLGACARAVLEGSRKQAKAAMRAWLDCERALMGEPPLHGALTPEQEAKVRIQMHYLPAQCFVDRMSLFSAVLRIRQLPAAIVQGMADPVCPPQMADKLRARWPQARWLPLPGQGHSGMAPETARACMWALDEVAGVR